MDHNILWLIGTLAVAVITNIGGITVSIIQHRKQDSTGGNILETLNDIRDDQQNQWKAINGLYAVVDDLRRKVSGDR